MNLAIYFYSGWYGLSLESMLQILLIFRPREYGGVTRAHNPMRGRFLFSLYLPVPKSDSLVRMASDEYG